MAGKSGGSIPARWSLVLFDLLSDGVENAEAREGEEVRFKKLKSRR